MQESRPGGMHPAWWTLILLVSTVGVVVATSALFSGSFKSYVPVTLISDRAGLVMDRGGKVKMRGVQVGRVGAISTGKDEVRIRLDMYPGEIRYIPANVRARIRATTLFSAKYVDLVYPSDPDRRRLAAGAAIKVDSVGTEVNTMFANLVKVLSQIDPAKLNGVLSALADSLRGHGAAIGQGITDANEVLLAVNPRAETIRADTRAAATVADTYSAAAQDILRALDGASVTGSTISDAPDLDALLANVIGLSRSGTQVLGANRDNLIRAANLLEPTTSLLMKYNPGLTCMLVGAKLALDTGYLEATGGANGYSLVIDSTPLFGADQYRYPQNLPIVGAKGGPGGKPGCGSLPDVAANWPLRQLITDTGWGTGLDIRPNPGIAFPAYADYLPITRGVPEPPSIRYPGGPAPGPIPYPGAPPYGAAQYAPDGTPLYPGLPPAPPPGAPREPGPAPPGSEPFVPPAPAQVQPTPSGH
ncbi:MULTISPECIES: MCE family protein [unclassified Mycobacterium]|uniref:MCE family protein n=1 Tax=unclassified Mycobacterium TaxID=2642494 RepID=UPI0007EF0208|nr:MULTISPECIES: MCE family protein [Mycobacterium]MDP7703122.1 MCE family protein [Mycobacterium sp. TY815]MDP7721614.1 MCE family protein [Mycobacterium sp. TY814]OBK58960.1 MCE-family protein MCE3A [Mycobacterium gordonae]